MRSDKPLQRGIAGIILLLGFFAVEGGSFYAVMNINWENMHSTAAAQIGAVLGGATSSTLVLASTYITWLFGSSADSARKTELLAAKPQ